MNNIVIIYERLGKCADAEKLKVEISNMESGLLGEEHSKTVRAVALLESIRSQGNLNASGTESKQTGEFYKL